MRGRILTAFPGRASRYRFAWLSDSENRFVCGAKGFSRVVKSGVRGRERELRPDPRGGFRVGEEDGSEGHVGRTGGDQLEGVPPGPDTSHADNRKLGRAAARVDGGERDRLERRARVAPDASAETGPQAPVEREPADRVHEGKAVGSGRLDGPGDLGDVPGGRRELGVERQGRRRPARGDDLRGRLGCLVDVGTGKVELDGRDFVAA